jgi:hypothetical protein
LLLLLVFSRCASFGGGGKNKSGAQNPKNSAKKLKDFPIENSFLTEK